MYTHVSECKNDEIKQKIKIKKKLCLNLSFVLELAQLVYVCIEITE
jgi:hypothetical protein